MSTKNQFKVLLDQAAALRVKMLAFEHKTLTNSDLDTIKDMVKQYSAKLSEIGIFYRAYSTTLPPLALGMRGNRDLSRVRSYLLKQGIDIPSEWNDLLHSM